MELESVLDLHGYRRGSRQLGESYEQHGSGLWLPPGEVPAPPRSVLGVDLFAGAGGMSCGFHQAGIHVVAAAEAWHGAAIAYLLNLGSPETRVHVLEFVPDKMHRKGARELHERYCGQTITAAELFEHYGAGDAPGDGWISGNTDESGSRACEEFYLGDVRQLTGARILADLGVAEGELGVVAGGPPCQGFSMAGRRNVVDPRNSLVFEFARLVLELEPQTMVMENVPGMLSMVTPEGIPVIDAFCHVLEEGGFGGYDALRKSILTSAGCGGAVRRKSQKGPGSADSGEPEPEPDGPVQLDLLGVEGEAS